MSTSLVIRNGTLQRDGLSLNPLAESFAYGYGVFTTLKVRAGKVAYFTQHWQRLRAGGEALGLSPPRTQAETLEDLHRLIDVENAADAIVKICLLREGKRTDQVVFMRGQLTAGPSSPPITLGLAPWPRFSQSIVVRQKTLNYLENWLALQNARRCGHDECLFLNERGEITEAATSNLFFRSGNRLHTPDLTCGLLPGVIRARLLELAPRAGLEVVEGICTLPDLVRAEEAFLTNSGSGIRRVASLHTDGRPREYGHARTQELQDLLLGDEARHLS